MKSRVRRILLSLAMLALIASACSSSSGGVTDTNLTGDTPATTDEGESDTGEPEPAGGTSIPVPLDDGAAEDAIAGLDGGQPSALDNPIQVAQSFARNGLNIDPSVEALQCIVDESATDPALEAALLKPGTVAGQVADDVDLEALMTAVNGCVDTISLGDWATEAVGPQGDVAETAPGCFADRFDGENGDNIFYAFTALTNQFRVPADGVDGLIDALATCTPITSLVEFFAEQTEFQSNFETTVDRECLMSELADPEISRGFWSTFVDGATPPADLMEPFIQSCSEEAAPQEPLPEGFVPWSGNRELAAVPPGTRAGVYSSPPPMTIDPALNYEAVIVTGGGEIRIRLFADTAPLTVNNFVSLARDGYYDGTIFHRVLEDFMAQGGDPTGTGTGGPGYQFADEVDGGPALDRKGLLAMANAGPNTNGSQFFITFVPTEWLTGNHTVFGEVIEGIELVDAIQLRDPNAPNGPGQVLESVTIIES